MEANRNPRYLSPFITVERRRLTTKCGTWLIEWGPGSPRPDHFMLYRLTGGEAHYVGTFLKLRRAVRAAVRWGGRPLAWESV